MRTASLAIWLERGMIEGNQGMKVYNMVGNLARIEYEGISQGKVYNTIRLFKHKRIFELEGCQAI